MTTHIDAARVNSHYAAVFAIVDSVVANALEDSANLSALLSHALRLAACERQLDLANRMLASTRLGLEAGLALFAAASARNQPVTYTLAGQTVTRQARVGADEAHIGRWETLFYCASILRDAKAVRALCDVAKSLPLGSSTRGESYVSHWFEVLHELGNSGRIDDQQMMRALEATDPDLLPEDVRDAALYLRVPAIDVLYRIALGDASALTAALAEALDKHRRYWTLTPENQRSTMGWVSWPLSALAEIARGRGSLVELESEYLIRAPRSAPA